jgi:hypothetical protein
LIAGPQPLLRAAEDTSRGINTVSIVDISPPPPGPSPWLPWAIGAAALLVAGAVAYRRAAGEDRDVPSRRVRIAITGLTWAATLTAMFAPRDYARAGWEFPLFLLARVALLTMFAAVLLGALDLMLDVFQPRRRRPWLLLGPAVFASVVPLTASIGDLSASISMLSDAGPGPLGLAGVAAGLVWWSCLPTLDLRLASIFD